MGKKDFLQDSSDVFAQMFSKETIEKINDKTDDKKEEKIETKKEIDNENITKNKTSYLENRKEDNHIEKKDNVKRQKIFNKNYRYNFYVDPVFNEYLSNITWIKRIKNSSVYFNELIKKDLIELLELPTESSIEDIEIAWEKYKKKNKI